MSAKPFRLEMDRSPRTSKGRPEPGTYELRLGDCRAEIGSLEEGAGVILTDPVWPNAPAGLFDVSDPVRLFAEVAAHFPRLARRVIVQLGSNSDPRFLSSLPASFKFVRACWLRYARPSYAGTVLGSGDVAYVFGSNEGPEGGTLLPGECTSSSNTGKEADHPCPRKLEHVRWLVDKFTRRGDLVIDPFAGSGTTGVACVELGRRFLGWEVSPTYHAIALARLRRAREQLDLFQPRAALSFSAANLSRKKRP